MEQERLKQVEEQEKIQAELKAARLLEQERLEEERRECDRIEHDLTGGFFFEHTLTAVLIQTEEDLAGDVADPSQQPSSSELTATGLDMGMDVEQDLEAGSESDDKVILPESCLNDLVQLDLFGNPRHPALCFRLTVPTPPAFVSDLIDTSSSNSASEKTRARRQTHCGVREFTAAEGTIGIPSGVWNNLRLPTPHSKSGGAPALPIKILIKFVLLPKITHLLVQPVQHAFTQHIVEIRRCLEENLSKHTTLSTSNVITVWYRGHAYSMIVKAMKKAASSAGKSVLVSAPGEVELPRVDSGEPEEVPSAGDDIQGGCLINTNVVIDFMESVEYQRHQRERPAETEPEPAGAKPKGYTLGSSAVSSVFTGEFSTVASATAVNKVNVSADSDPATASAVCVPNPVAGMSDKELMRQKRLEAMQARESQSQSH